MKLSCLLVPAFLLVCLPHCMVNGELVGPKNLSGTTTSKGATSDRTSTKSAPLGRTESNTDGGERTERASNGSVLPDTKGIKLSPNGLPYTTQAGAGPVTDWPPEVQNPFVPDAFSGLTNAKHKQTYDGAEHEYDACMDKVKTEFQAAFEPNNVADIQRETRKNREKQIGEQQERTINQRCGKLARQAQNVELRVTKEAALEQLAFRNSLYAANRERFGKK